MQGEFPTNITPWQQVARQHNLTLEWMNTDDFRTPSLGFDVGGSVTKGITMMAVSAVQFQTGLRLPVEDIGKICHKYNCLLFVDAIQCVGATPIDLTNIDF